MPLAADLQEVEGLCADLAFKVKLLAIEVLRSVHDAFEIFHLLLHDDKMLDIDAIRHRAEERKEAFLLLFRRHGRVDRLDVDRRILLVSKEVAQVFEILLEVDAHAARLLIARGVEPLHGDVDVRDTRRDECVALLGREQKPVRDDFHAPRDVGIDDLFDERRQKRIRQRLTQPRKDDALDAALRELFEIMHNLVKVRLIHVQHAVPELLKLAARLVARRMDAVKALEVTVFRLLDVYGERLRQRYDVRELLPLRVIIRFDFCHIYSPSAKA